MTPRLLFPKRWLGFALERAIEVAPSDAFGHLCYGEVLSYAGRPEEGIRQIQAAMRLNPHYSAMYLYFLGLAYDRAGRSEEAITTQKKALAREPYFWLSYIRLAILYTELEQHAEARTAIAEALKINPHFTLEVMAEQKVLYKDPAVFEREFAALRQAGLE